MRYVYNLQIDLSSNGNEIRVLKKIVSKLNQVINLLEGSNSLHRGGFADDVAFVDYWFSREPTLEINNSYMTESKEMVPKVRCEECQGQGEIETDLNPDCITMECPHCEGSGWRDVR